MRLYKSFLSIMLLLCAVMSIKAQQMATYDRLNNDGYNYWFYKPAGISEDSISKPLIVFLHGQSLCGKNMNNVLRYGTLDAIRRGRKIDAYVIAPQNPGGRWDPAKVINIVDWAIGNHNIDSCRVYVLGMSLGGFGTINVASAYPDRFAAAMALCGGGNNPDYVALNKIPLWILHGTADRAVKIRDSDDVVKGMRSVQKPERLIYNRLKGKNHSILARIFYMPQTYDWLFSHSLNDSLRTLCTDYSIDNGDFNTAYSDLSSPSWQGIEKADFRDKKSASRADDEPVSSGTQYHKVRQGDTLSAIARRYHTSVKKLCSLNGIKETTVLQIGRRLKVR